jgi:sulfatase maturation enzyme AslB (radical SAM superfamily)
MQFREIPRYIRFCLDRKEKGLGNHILFRVWKILSPRFRIRFSQRMQNNFFWKKIVLRWYRLYAKKELQIELTDICNLRCSYCPKSSGIGIKGKHFEWDDLVKIIADAVRCGYDRFHLVGYGEPFLYPKLLQAISFIKQLKPNAYIATITNGTKLDYKIGKQVAEAGLSALSISINSTTAEQYAKLNNSSPSSYDTLVKGVQEFLRAVNESHAAMTVSLQVFGGLVNNANEIQRFRDFWTPYLGKCGAIIVAEMVNWGGGGSNVLPSLCHTRKVIHVFCFLMGISSRVRKIFLLVANYPLEILVTWK